MTKNIKYLAISDIHLGHKRNKTENIIYNLNIFFDYFSSKTPFPDIDIFFIVGDLFDRLLDFSSDDIYEVIPWLNSLMKFCLRNNIKLRILEGTPSHDWRQSRIAETIFKLIPEGLDFKYIDTLYIEDMKDLDLKILYVPDEWTDNADKTYLQVLDLLREKNIDKVDLAMMHGLFNYQLKNMPNNNIKHDESNYLNIVNHFINIGHIHTFSTYENIIAQGSFDRLSHGEEEPKGAVLCTISDEGNSFVFIENKLAKIYKTITLKNKDLEKSLKKLDKELHGLPIDSNIRIKANKDHPIYIAIEDIKSRYVNYNFTKMSIEDEEESNTISIQMDDNYVPITITKENIKDSLLVELTKYDLSDKQLNIIEELIDLNR